MNNVENHVILRQSSCEVELWPYHVSKTVWSTQCGDHFRGVDSDATPSLLCHKEPARIQSPLLGALERKIPLGGYFACSSLVLYGIRAPIIGPFRAWKPPILMP